MREVICEMIATNGGTPYYVGGSVRDELLGLQPKDFDIEVFDMRPEALRRILNKFGVVNEVGDSFGVFKMRFDDYEIDFATPRRENKVGRGHRGFLMEFDPTMTVAEAASRRDFTINSIYKHGVTGEILDFFNGAKHLEMGHLQAVSDKFIEDPLRVLRGMQLISRFEMYSVSGRLANACGHLRDEYYSLPKERVGEEWRKWATKAKYPANGLWFLEVARWIFLWPELGWMMTTDQDPKWHPEGNAWQHTKYVCDAMASICGRDGIEGEDREVLMFAALTHDLGKVHTTEFIDGRLRSRGHAEAGVPIARNFLKSIGVYDRVIDRVLPLVAEHMFPTWEKQTRRTIRRLKLRLGRATLDELLLLMESDHSGRPPYPAAKPEGHDMMVELAAELPPTIEPIITGRHIIQLGVTEGKEIGRIKKLVFEGQLNEEFSDVPGGIEWLKRNVFDGKTE